MSERITDARLRELTAAMPDRMGGTLVDTLFLRELAAEVLAARTDASRTLAAEAAARGAASREQEAANEAAMLRAQVTALTARVVDAEAARLTTELVGIGAALGREGATAGECVALIGLIGRTCARLTDERNEAVRALDEERRMWTRPTMEPHP